MAQPDAMTKMVIVMKMLNDFLFSLKEERPQKMEQSTKVADAIGKLLHDNDLCVCAAKDEGGRGDIMLAHLMFATLIFQEQEDRDAAAREAKGVGPYGKQGGAETLH